MPAPQKVRHLDQFSDDRLAIALAEAKRQTVIRCLESAAIDHFAQVNGFAIGIRQFDADDVRPRTTPATRAESADMEQAISSVRPMTREDDAGRRFKLVERDDGQGGHG